MRTTVELLQVLDQYLEHECTRGLCALVKTLNNEGLIDYNERVYLERYLEVYAPFGKTTSRYWWPYGEIAPRRKWLRKRIRIEKINETLNKFLKSIVIWKGEHS